MDLIEGMLKKSTIENSKGGEYYSTSYDSNLDLFSGVMRYTDEDKIIRIFKNAFKENKDLAVANLLYFLDIREGKGERKVFKILFNTLCNLDEKYAEIVLNSIMDLGRCDYILEAFCTPLEKKAIDLINFQLSKDLISDTPSLLAKWLPSVSTHNKVKIKSVEIAKKLGYTISGYRKMLSKIREKIDIVERKMSLNEWDKIDFEKVPTKAMLKYRNAFNKHCEEKYQKYLDSVNLGKAKVNTKGLFCYDIINKVSGSYRPSQSERNLFNAMWEQQKDIFKDNNSNVLVMADTSGSMTWMDEAIGSSIGLAIYTAERNHGIFKDYYMTFSSKPLLQKVQGIDIYDKVKNMECIVDNTDIDEAFKLLLNTCVENNIKQEDIPTHLIIVSDMEFDRGVYSENGTNFEGWKKAFEEKGYTLPQIIFWNLGAGDGFPVTKFDNNVCMISGFSTSVLQNLLNSDVLSNLTPLNTMLDSLKKYLDIIEKGKQ